VFQCETSAAFPFKADIYTQTTAQDPVTNQMVKTWVLSETVACSAKSSMSRTSLGEGSFLKPDGVNSYTDYVKLRCSKSLPLGRMVRNIRNENGDILWTESDDRSEVNIDTMFEIRGNTPIFDTVGKVVCYENIMARMDVQA
jgi:hypothetical protein